MEIVPNIHLVDGSVGCNTYIVVDDGITLVDTGLRGNIPKIYNCLSRVGHGPKDVKRIVITHAHLDHINCLHRLRLDTGATVIAGEAEADIVSGKKPLYSLGGAFGTIFGVLKAYYRYVPVPVDVRLKDGDLIPGAFDIRAVGLPGHSEGNMGLYTRDKRAFFSSDSVRVIDGKIAPPSPHFTPDMGAAVASIKRIGEHDFDALLPGHGRVVVGDAAARVRELYREIRP